MVYVKVSIEIEAEDDEGKEEPFTAVLVKDVRDLSNGEAAYLIENIVELVKKAKEGQH